MIARWLTGAIGPYILAAVAALVAGLLIWGLYLRADNAVQHGKVDNLELRLSTTEEKLSAAEDELEAERKAFREAADTATALAAAQQSDTTELLHRLGELQTQFRTLKREIADANLTAPVAAPIDGVCVGHPVSGPEFEQLFNAAADRAPEGGHPAAGGMPAGSAGAQSGDAGDPAR